LLDVDCGLGGTAKYVQDHGWGTVVGLDVEPASIARVRQAYPGIEFHACDVAQASSVIGRKYDVIYLFNSLYAFGDQPRAPPGLAQLAKQSGQFTLFDYTGRGGYDSNPVMCDGEPLIPHSLRLSAIRDTLRRAGWQLTEVADLTGAYDRWYDSLVQRMDGKRAQLVGIVGAEGFSFVRGTYVGLLGAIRSGRLGGAFVRARHSDTSQ
jgi:hypothetical protein